MTAFLQSLLTVGLTAGWIVAAVLVLRVVLKKAPRWITVCLWALVALRLLVPVSVESPVGFVPATRVEQWVETVVPPSVAPREEPLSATLPTTQPPKTPQASAEAVPVPSMPAKEHAKPIPWDAILLGVWGVGVLAMLIYATVSTACLYARMRDAVKTAGRCYQSDRVSSPFVLGLFRPRIYMPYGLETEERLYVQAHEEAHIKRGDHLWKPLGFVLLSVYWFQPLLWVGYRCLCRDIEAACDERVVKALSPDERKRYSYTLVAVGQERRRIAACPVAFGETGIKERVKRVMNYKKPAVWLLAAAVILAAVAAVFLFTNRAPSEAPVAGTFEGAKIQVNSDPYQAAGMHSMEVKSGEYLMLEDGSEELLQFRIDKVDLEEMAVTLSFSKPLWVDGAKSETLTVPYDSEEISLCSDEGQGEERYVYTLRLSMPVSSTAGFDYDIFVDLDWNEDRCARRTVYDSDELELTLHEDLEIFALTFGRLSSHVMRGTVVQTEERLELTEDGGVTKYVFDKETNGRLRYNAEASYRHKRSYSLALEEGTLLEHAYSITVQEINDMKSSERQRVTVTDFDGRVVLEDERFSGGAKEERLSDGLLRIGGYYDTKNGLDNRHLYVDLGTMTALGTYDSVVSDKNSNATASLEEADGKHYVHVVQYEAGSYCGNSPIPTLVDTKFRLYSVEDISAANVRVWLEEIYLTVAYTGKDGKRVVTVYNWHTGERVESTVHTVGGSATADPQAGIQAVFMQDGRTLYYSGAEYVFYHLGDGNYAELLSLLESGEVTLAMLTEQLRADLQNGALKQVASYRDGGTRTATYDENDASQGVTLRTRATDDRYVYIGDCEAALAHTPVQSEVSEGTV